MRDFTHKYKYDVLSVGEATVDAYLTIDDSKHVFRIDQEDHNLCIRPGSKISVDRYKLSMGGNATNVTVGLNRMGIKVGLCAEIGDDELSLKIRNSLAKENIERLLIKQTLNGATNFSVILNFSGDRTIFKNDVKREHDFDLSDVTAPLVYLTSMSDDWKRPYQRILSFIRENNSVLAFNPGGRQIKEGKLLVEEVLQRTSLLFVNKEEAELILFDKQTDKQEEGYVKELGQRLQKIGPKVVVITDGKKGSYALDESGEFYHRASGEGKVVERTGTGDAYSTGFLAATINGFSVSESMKWGAANATSVVGKVGAEAGLLTKKEIEEALS
jgi:ribokinase